MLFRTSLAVVLLTAGAFAQVSSFPKPSYFRETFAKTQTKVELRDPVRLKDYVVDGKLELSLKNYLELVMSNNTDIQLQLLSLEIPKNNIQAAFGVFDPTALARFSTTRQTSVPTSALDARTADATTKSLLQPYSLQYTQTLPTGTQYVVQFSGQKTSRTNSFANYNPLLTAGTGVSINQPLLRDRGTYVNRIPIMQAQSNFKVSEYQLRNQLLTLINTAESAYWNVISARETLRVQEKARDTAAAYLQYMQQQLDLGALSPLDIYNPKQSLAAAEVAVSQARFTLVQAEDSLRRQLSVDLDPEIRKLPIVLTESVDLGPSESLNSDRELSVNRALETNPSIKAAAQKLDVDNLGIQSAKNALLPRLTLNAGYTTTGQGGILYPGTSLANGVASALAPVVGGLGDAFSQMFGFGYPTYVAGLTLNLPIRSRTASANMANAVIVRKQDTLTLRTTEQSIRLNVLNALTALEGAKESLKLANTQREFAKLNEDAMEEKYRLGAEINQNVINAQQNLAAAELQVVSSQISLRRSLLNLLTQTGELLDVRGIVIK
jgi:outer membrane protein